MPTEIERRDNLGHIHRYVDYIVVEMSAADLATRHGFPCQLGITLDPLAAHIYDGSTWRVLQATTQTVPAREGHVITDEGTTLTQRASLNFTGAGVTASDDSAHNRTNVSVPAASETVVGAAEIATQAETDAGTDDARFITPLKLASRTGTESRAGILELATAAETSTGTDSSRAVHPAGFKAGITPEAWQSPTLLNSWVAWGAPFESPGFRKTPWGEVQLRGAIKNGVITTDTILFTLPVGYRPANERIFPAVAGGPSFCRIDVEPDGSVRILGASSNSTVSLEGIRFDV